MIERAALALLVAMTVVFGYNILGASVRFGNATEAFDGFTAEYVDFQFLRGAQDVNFTIDVVNPTDHPVIVEAFDYSFLANGVGVGGGEYWGASEVPAHSRVQFNLSGLVFDQNYIDNQPEDEPLDWYVPITVLVRVDRDLEPTWVVFGFRAQTP